MSHPVHSTRDLSPQAATPKRPRFPKFTGSNAGALMLVRRMTKSSTGGFAPLRVVEDRDDTGPAAAGYNLLGQVVCVAPLDEAERARFAELANRPMNRNAPPEVDQERAFWERLPRLTAPGLDIDPIKVDQADGSKATTPAGRARAQDLARRLIGIEFDNGIGLRAAWSSGAQGSGGIHLDWRWPIGIAEVDLLRAIKARTAKVCAEHGIPTSDTKTKDDQAWVDLAPLNHATNNRGRLWRPLGGLHKDGKNRKELIGWPTPSTGELTRAELLPFLDELANDEADTKQRAKRKRVKRSPLETVAPIIPRRQAELGELRAFLAGQRDTTDGGARQKQRMAWAACLLLDGIRERDVRWCLAKAIGNARACARLVTRTRGLIEAGSEGHPGPTQRYLARGYLEGRYGTPTLAAYGEILARITTKDKARDEATGVKDAAGGLRALVRSVSGLNRNAKTALVAEAERLRVVDAEDPAIGGLLRPSICRTIHEWVTCSMCSGERGRRRIACEDEICAWCHGSRVLHENDLALADWKAAGVAEVLVLRVDGFKRLADSDAWVRTLALGRQDVKVLRVRTLTYDEPTMEELDRAKEAGDLDPAGAVRFGVLLVAGYKGWTEAILRGAFLRARGRLDGQGDATGLTATMDRYTAAGAVEQVARARWGVHMALRTAATLGEVKELADVLRQTFRRRAASSGKGALSWPGRSAVRESITEAVAERRDQEEAAEDAAREERGEAPPRHGEAGHKCEGCPAPFAKPVHNLMSSGRPDARIVHSQEWKHTLERAHRLLAHDLKRRQGIEAATAQAQADATAYRDRIESRERVPF